MVVKFFSNKKGGSTKALDYLLNHREKDGTAKVLVGDEQLTRNIINSISFKHKVCVGCLSFEEENINEDLKYKIMEDFEKHLLPSLDSDQYNILWVEHVDKGRLELNFVIPKIELTRKIALNPFYHKQDLSRVDTWQNLTNITYGFTDPKDPAKQRTLQGASKKISLQKDYEQLDVTLHELVKSGQIKNRDQMIELLNQNQIFVNRVGSDYISIKLPDSKKARRYKGGIYSEEFRSVGEFKNMCEREERRVDEYNRRDTQSEIRFYRDKLNEYTKRKSKYIQSKYPRRVESKEQISTNYNWSYKSNSVNYNNDVLFPTAKSNAKFTDLANTFRFTIHTRKSEVYKSTNKRAVTKSRQINNFYKNKGVKDDSTRTTIKSRITKEREAKYRAYLEARETRDRILRQNISNAENLRIKLKEYNERQYEIQQYIIGKIRSLGRIIEKLARELKSRIENIKIKKLVKVEESSSINEIINESDKKVRRKR